MYFTHVYLGSGFHWRCRVLSESFIEKRARQESTLYCLIDGSLVDITISIQASWNEVNIPFQKIDFEKNSLIGHGRFGNVSPCYRDISWHYEHFDFLPLFRFCEAITLVTLQWNFWIWIILKSPSDWMSSNPKWQHIRFGFKLLSLGFFFLIIMNRCFLQNTRHDNIVLFLGYCIESDKFGIVMSLCKGRPLHSILHETNDPIDLGTALVIATQICQVSTCRQNCGNGIFLAPQHEANGTFIEGSFISSHEENTPQGSPFQEHFHRKQKQSSDHRFWVVQHETLEASEQVYYSCRNLLLKVLQRKTLRIMYGSLQKLHNDCSGALVVVLGSRAYKSFKWRLARVTIFGKYWCVCLQVCSKTFDLNVLT